MVSGGKARPYVHRALALALVALVAVNLPAEAAKKLSGLCLKAYARIVEGQDSRGRSRLAQALKRLPAEERNTITEVLDAVAALDYPTLAPQLLAGFLGRRRLAEMNFSEAPSSGGLLEMLGLGAGRSASPIENFRKARNYLSRRSGEWDRSALEGVHERIAEGRLDPAAETTGGQIRSGLAAAENVVLTAEQLRAVKANPYLTFLESGREGDRITGDLIYPHPAHVGNKALELIAARDPELVRRIREYQKALETDPLPEFFEADQRRLVELLVEERVERLNERLKSLGKADTPQKAQHRALLLGEFVRDLVAIRPFEEFNSEVIRAVMHDMFEKFDLPPPRLRDVEEAIRLTPGAWEDQILHAMESTQRLREDIARRIEAGLPVEHSPELLTPYIPRAVEVATRRQGRLGSERKPHIEELEPAKFEAFLRAKFRTDPELALRFQRDPSETSRQLHDEYQALATRHRVNVIPQYSGTVEALPIHLIEPEYYDIFGTVTSRDPKAWNAKIDRWHDRQIVWRGLPYFVLKVSEAEIISMFTTVHPHLVSNRIRKRRFWTPRSMMKNMVLSEFDRHNDATVTGEIVDYAMDHHRTGPRYGDSYGYSTSRRWSVGRDFAMGAMVVAPYGEHREKQGRITDRINVGVYRTKKDIPLFRLKMQEPSFSYKYYKQSEVMGVGGADPDSVMVVQRIDAAGSPTVSYARNPNKPSEIWVVRGGFTPEPGKVPEKKDLIKTIQLPR